MLKPSVFSPRRLLAGLLLAAAITGSSQALVVLTIDVTNPADVVIKATTNFSAGNSSLTTIEGFTIENFFKSIQDVTSATIPTGDLSPVGQLTKYDAIQTFDYNANTGNFSTGNDLTVYALSSAPQNFTTTSAPFTGAMHVNMTSYASALPSPGNTGTVYSGYLQSGSGAGQGATLGQWQVIPEPSSAALAAAGVIALAVRRRRTA